GSNGFSRSHCSLLSQNSPTDYLSSTQRLNHIKGAKGILFMGPSPRTAFAKIPAWIWIASVPFYLFAPLIAGHYQAAKEDAKSYPNLIAAAYVAPVDCPSQWTGQNMIADKCLLPHYEFRTGRMIDRFGVHGLGAHEVGWFRIGDDAAEVGLCTYNAGRYCEIVDGKKGVFGRHNQR
ncbi:MAG: hypothetical protein ACYDD1_21420, partial [Caulobacteraceae bacterium]